MNQRAARNRRADDLAARVWELLGIQVDLTSPERGPGLAHVQSACLDRISSTPNAALRPQVVELFCEIDQLRDDSSERAMIERARRLTECERGLIRLRERTTTAGLIDGVCDELIRSLGFERTMLARVEHGAWRPWKANTSMLDESWVADWIERAIPLDETTLETRMLTDRRPALILDTSADGIAQIVHAAGVRSYVAAPIVPGGEVIGFFHADHGRAGRTCDEADRDMLWTFAEGFGHLYERTALREQLHARAEQVRTSTSGLAQAMDQLRDAALALVEDERSGADERAFRQRPAISSRLARCTARELEVLELVVAGARNTEIADRLAITEGTVKSHVTHLLAKLGVENRSQAIAAYLGV